MGSLGTILGVNTEKAFLVDLTTQEEKFFQLNPTELEEVFAVRWQMFESLGYSHQKPQFLRGENVRWRFTAIFDQALYDRDRKKSSQNSFVDDSGNQLIPSAPALPPRAVSEVEDWRNFMVSLTKPRRVKAGGANQFGALSPAPVHFEWPGLVSTTIRVERATVRHTLFLDGKPRARIMNIAFEVFEDPAARLYADDARKNGTIQPWASSSPSNRAKK